MDSISALNLKMLVDMPVNFLGLAVCKQPKFEIGCFKKD